MAGRRCAFHRARPLRSRRSSRAAAALPRRAGALPIGRTGDVQLHAVGNVGRGSARTCAAHRRTGGTGRRDGGRLGDERRGMARRRAYAGARGGARIACERGGVACRESHCADDAAHHARRNGRCNVRRLRRSARACRRATGVPTPRARARARCARLSTVDAAHDGSGPDARRADHRAAESRRAGGTRCARDPPHAARPRPVSDDAAIGPRSAEGAVAHVTVQASADWVARGRHHQWQRRPIDAMLCFRRAVREGPRAFDARYHLGEVLWELGRLPDAIAVWREAAVLAPDLPAAYQALAEALLGTGDVAGARAAAVRVIELHNDDPRAQAIVAIASLSSTDDAQSAQTIAHLLARDAGLLAVPSIAGTLAQVLDDAPSGTARAAIVDATIAADPAATHVAAMPALLLALVAERLAEASPVAADARARWGAAMLARAWAARDHDALRRVAFAIGEFASQSGRELGQHYAALCERVERPSVPLVWPRRTRGNRLRIVTLIGADALDLAAHRAQAMLTGLPAARFDVLSAIIGGQGRAADDVLPRVGLPRRPASTDARRLAALDADVIVDLVGLSAAAGALLAQRPARTRMTIAALAAPNAAPLVDVVCADTEALAVALERMGDAIEPANDATLDAAALNALWVDAVSAHRQGDRAGARA